MRGRKNSKTCVFLSVLLAVGFTMSVVGTAAAQAEIPEGATIDWATLSVYVVQIESGARTVNVHRATAEWQENSVTWNNFGNSFAPEIVDSFVADALGWHSADVTDLVSDWIDGIYPNYGLVLEQDATEWRDFTEYASSESAAVEMRPILEIGYTTPSGSSSVTIQRLGAAQEDVADAYVWELEPNNNWGMSDILLTGIVNGYWKNTLIQFDITTVCRGGGGHTPGFWQNKNGQALIEPQDVDTLNALCLRNDDGSHADFADKKEFKGWIKARRAKNMAYQLSGHLAAMTMNVEVGFVNGCALVYLNGDGDMISINDLMAAANEALCEDGYTPSGDENRDYQEMLKDALDYANNNINWVNP